MDFAQQNVSENSFSKNSSMGAKRDPKKISRLNVDPEVLSLVHLAQYTGDDTALEYELLGLFKDQAILQIENISSADCESDWAMAVHTLKGSARCIGAGQVALLTKELEIVQYNGSPTEKRTLTGQLANAVARCVSTIETLL